MIWPGMGDPYKRKKTIKFLLMTAAIGVVAVVITTMVVNPILGQQPHSACINDVQKNWKISFTVELFVDNEKADIPANIGFKGDCQRAIYTLSNDGTVFAEWENNPDFEIGHFLWIFEFPIRDMEQSKSKIFVNGKESDLFINAPLQDGFHYKGEFITKAYDSSKDSDFLPEK